MLLPSLAEFAATVTTTFAEPEGVTTSVYSSPLPVKAPFVPPVTVTSPVTNPVTSSENVNVAVSAAVELIFGGTPPISTVGAPTSHVAVAETADAGPVFRPSVAEFAATVTVTSAEPVGVTASVYSVPLTAVNVPFEPPLTVTSPVTNSVTSSENVNVAVNSAVESISGGTPVISTVGTAASQTAVAETADAGPVLTPSVAASSATVTVRSDPLVGLTVKMYVRPRPPMLPRFVPPVTVTSSATNSVTSSEKTNIAAKSAVELIFAGNPLISTVGTVASQTAVAETADAGPVLTPSVAESAVTVTTTSAEPVGVTASVYSVPLTAVNAPFVPPVTVTSPVTNSVTSSENVNVTPRAAVELIFDGTPVTSTVGTASQIAVAETADAGPVLLPSVAEFAATVTVTADPLVGVTASVYSVPLTAVNAPFVPPVTVTSPVTNPVTAFENVNVAVSAAVELIVAGTPVISTVGAATSHVAVAETADAGPVFRPSVAEFAATVTVTASEPVGVTASVYSVPLTAVNAPFVPPVTVTSPVTNPVTASENVNVAVSAAVESIVAGTPVISTVGAATSHVAVTDTADAGPVVFRPSVAEFAATVTVTSDPLVGVTANVYVVPLTAVNAPFVPPVTVTSPVTNPVTASDHVNVTSHEPVELNLEGTLVISTVGAVGPPSSS